jgi:hypothetical protein
MIPNNEEYRNYISELYHSAIDTKSFITNAIIADRHRFTYGKEWAETPQINQIRRCIFGNDNPSAGLLLFVLSCWLDLQASYKVVWSTYLDQADRWIQLHAWKNSENGLPRGNYKQTKTHLLKTINTLSSPKYNHSFAEWFTYTVIDIVDQNGSNNGNIYRFVSKVCNDLYEASNGNFLNSVTKGNLQDTYAHQHYKRLWMLVMFLRRDKTVIQCLLKRSLQQEQNGQRALDYWYNEHFFNPIECELPTDSRVQASWMKLKFLGPTLKTAEQVAMSARMLARKNNISPSTFDAILFT